MAILLRSFIGAGPGIPGRGFLSHPVETSGLGTRVFSKELPEEWHERTVLGQSRYDALRCPAPICIHRLTKVGATPKISKGERP